MGAIALHSENFYFLHVSNIMLMMIGLLMLQVLF